MCFYLFAGIILFIIFLKHFQKIFDECYREKVDSGMAFFFFRCCHGEHRKRCKYCPYYVDIKEEGNEMNNSKRNYRVEVRLSEEENKQLEFLSNEFGISKSEVIRELITDSSYELYYGHKRGKKYD